MNENRKPRRDRHPRTREVASMPVREMLALIGVLLTELQATLRLVLDDAQYWKVINTFVFRLTKRLKPEPHE